MAGDNDEDVKTVANIVDMLGFDSYIVGTLDETKGLEAGGPAFGTSVLLVQLRKLLH